MGTLSGRSLGGGAGLELGTDYPSAQVLVGVSRVRADLVTHGPATPTETLTCTRWTGPLGLKQRRHRLTSGSPFASEELPVPRMLPLQGALRGADMCWAAASLRGGTFLCGRSSDRPPHCPPCPPRPPTPQIVSLSHFGERQSMKSSQELFF